MDPRRRLFLRGALQQARAPGVAPPPRPPWALHGEADFAARCTRCGDCVRACPRSLLSPGDGGFPQIRFDTQGCSLCGDCRAACPTGALSREPDAPAFRWRVRIADHCLAQRQVECRLCGDACDTKALRFVPARGGISQLQVQLDACTGCGDCVAPCPVNAIEMALPTLETP